MFHLGSGARVGTSLGGPGRKGGLQRREQARKLQKRGKMNAGLSPGDQPGKLRLERESDVSKVIQQVRNSWDQSQVSSRPGCEAVSPSPVTWSDSSAS